MVSTSIIIPTYKRKESLICLLRSLKDQITDKEEIIIVEQGEDNKTAFLSVAKECHLQCTYIHNSPIGTSGAKNLGARQAQGKFLIFFDDDVIVKTDCVAHLTRNLSDTTVGVVGGRVITPGQKIEENREDVGRISLLSQFSDGFSSHVKQEVDTVIGCNMAIRREIFETIHGFDKQFIGAFREESDLCLRVKKSGLRIIFEPAAEVVHDRAQSGGARKTEGRMQWYFMFFSNETYFFLKHRPLIFLPLFFFTRLSYVLRCMFGLGREISFRSLRTPWKGIGNGIRLWRKTRSKTIGVDAGALAVSDSRLKVGVWRMTYELLKQLSFLDTTNQYRLYSFSPIDDSLLRQLGSRMKNVVLSPPFGYMKLRLPWELLIHPVDIFIGLSQALPVTFFTKKIGCIYDLGFLHIGKSYGTSYRKLQKQTEEVVRRSDRIVTISKYSKKDIMKTYGEEKNTITVIYPGVSVSMIQKKHARSRPYILFVGALKRAKNIPATISGFREFLKNTKKEYDLYLVGGDYWMDPDIRKTITGYSLEDHVRITGHIPADKDLAQYYRGASAFISLGKWEGFCIPAVEAMGYGVPVVYADSGALPEIVGEAGIAVDPSDPIAVGKALTKVIADSQLRQSCIEKGKKRAHDFSWDTYGRQWFDMINALK